MVRPSPEGSRYCLSRLMVEQHAESSHVESPSPKANSQALMLNNVRDATLEIRKHLEDSIREQI
jgi:hypothetical protein